MNEITQDLVKTLIMEQFPEWAHLPIWPVAKNGHDNSTFHLGNKMSIRLPNGKLYATQIEKENKWLPYLRAHLPFPISCPLAQGVPSELYPYPWSINRWIDGDTADHANVMDLNQFAKDLAMFLHNLQAIDASQGPTAGQHNFYRGADVNVYNDEIQEAFKALEDTLPVEKLTLVWQKAISSRWDRSKVWVHGDVAPSNLLVSNGSLSGMIDFGILGTGDPACDYVMAWTFFDERSRKIFFECSGCDEATWDRAKGWALWKAMITFTSQDDLQAQNARNTIQSILNDQQLNQNVDIIGINEAEPNKEMSLCMN